MRYITRLSSGVEIDGFSSVRLVPSSMTILWSDLPVKLSTMISSMNNLMICIMLSQLKLQWEVRKRVSKPFDK